MKSPYGYGALPLSAFGNELPSGGLLLHGVSLPLSAQSCNNLNPCRKLHAASASKDPFRHLWCAWVGTGEGYTHILCLLHWVLRHANCVRLRVRQLSWPISNFIDMYLVSWHFALAMYGWGWRRTDPDRLYTFGCAMLTFSSMPKSLDKGWGVPGLVITMVLIDLGGGGFYSLMPAFLGKYNSPDGLHLLTSSS